jgi:hypothetical protein
MVLTIFQVTGRILIDYFGFAKHQDGLQRNEGASRQGRNKQGNSSSTEKESTYVSSLPRESRDENKKVMLGERKDDLVFMSPLLKGFTLKNKLWRRHHP